MPKPFGIIICGAGLGGLGAAIALRRKGHHVTVVESASQLNEIGAGIQIPPNSSRILKSWGLEEKFLEKVVWPIRRQIRRYATGEIVGMTEIHPFLTEYYGCPYWLIHRADYQKILHDSAKQIGVQVLLGRPVESVDENGPRVIFKDGSQMTADLIIGADGIRSTVRKAILKDKDVEVVDSANCAYRATIPAEVMNSDPTIAHLMADPSWNLWIGHERHIMAYPIRNATLYNVVMSHPGKASVGKWNEPGDVEEMRNHYSNWEPNVRQILSHIDHCLKWKLAYLPPLEKWFSDNGRVVLIGDAAHAMLPYKAQGAAVSIEDGAALAECLDHAQDNSDFPKLLFAFQQVRKPRCDDISRDAIGNGNVWHFPDGPAQQHRDQQMKEMFKETNREKDAKTVDKWLTKKLQPELFAYDAVKEMNDFFGKRGASLITQV